MRQFVNPVGHQAVAAIALVRTPIGPGVVEVLNIHLIVIRPVVSANIGSGSAQALAEGVVRVEGDAVREALTNRRLPCVVLAVLRVVHIIAAENQVRIGANARQPVRQIRPAVENELDAAHADISGFQHQ